MISLTDNPPATNQIRLRLRKLVKDTSALDVFRPPTPTPPEPAVGFDRDRIHNPQNQDWRAILPDLDVLEGIFPESSWPKIRRVSHLEHMISRSWSTSMRRKFPMPCEGRDQIALVDNRGRLSRAERPTHTEYCYLTVADYPEWLSDPVKRERALAEYALSTYGL